MSTRIQGSVYKSICVDAFGTLFINVGGRLRLNEPLLTLLNVYKPKFKLGLLTSTDLPRVEGVNIIELSKIFDLILIPYMIGYDKSEPEFYAEAAQRLNLRTDEIIFLDNDQSFLDAAAKAGMYGMKTILYTGVDSLSQIKSALESN